MDNILYYDPSRRSLLDKISAAVVLYQRKYHNNPNACLVHPACTHINFRVSLGEANVLVVPSATISRNHFLVG